MKTGRKNAREASKRRTPAGTKHRSMISAENPGSGISKAGTSESVSAESGAAECRAAESEIPESRPSDSGVPLSGRISDGISGSAGPDPAAGAFPGPGGSRAEEETMIYYVEDDDNIRDLVIYTLNSTGLKAEGFPDGKAFWNAMRAEVPELVLLDIMLPGDDGVTILRQLRADSRYASVPVIMATARGTEYDKVRALDLGADDYVTKPYAMMELVSRVKAVLRRSERKSSSDASDSGARRPASENQLLKYGPISLDSRRHLVTVNGRETELTLKEYELLRKLLLNPECVLTRDQLLEDVWGYEFDGETRTVDVHVRTLRQKLQEAGSLIETVRGVGYRIRA